MTGWSYLLKTAKIVTASSMKHLKLSQLMRFLVSYSMELPMREELSLKIRSVCQQGLRFALGLIFSR